ncbi:class A sortase [Macrococcoides goetzii]|uniref:Class A sortase n=2 Tax=Macrococcoides canis TaxID=1855823 RepID=A0A4R6C2N6_9STAP|nr:class A sortase [Macrococcus canis]TDM38950.1 class A sortase [Macrococcus goetzii]TDM29321.1 class A sortase [Macrococcus canis]TDM31987.1 class A sortase [Macrococcus canis]TDM39927.1 class A sortase [Macrococcus canis]
MKKNIIIKSLFVLFIIVGLLISVAPFVINNVIEPYHMNKIHEEANSVSKQKIKENQEKIKAMQQVADSSISSTDNNGTTTNDINNKEKKENYDSISYDPSAIQSLSSIPKFQEVNKNFLVGYIQIPEVNLELPVLEGLTNENLNVATGTMKPGQEMGKRNYAIAGHHMPNENLLFSPLMRVKIGNLVYLTDKDRTYVYKVTKTEVLSINRGDVIEDSEGDKIITLITCTDIQGTARLMVRGSLTKVMNH